MTETLGYTGKEYLPRIFQPVSKISIQKIHKMVFFMYLIGGMSKGSVGS